MSFITLICFHALLSLCVCMKHTRLDTYLSNKQNCQSLFDYEESFLLKLMDVEKAMGYIRHTIEQLTVEEEKLSRHVTEDHKKFKSTMKEWKSDYETMQVNFTTSIQDMGHRVDRISTEITKPSANSTEVFTVKEPSQGPIPNTITFKQAVLIEGFGFKIATGQFTCTFPGIYHFSVYLVKMKAPRVDMVTCNICKNGVHVVIAYIDPDDSADIGSYGVSNAAYVRLAKGDVVNLCDCSGVDSMDPQSSFSGRLVDRNLTAS